VTAPTAGQGVWPARIRVGRGVKGLDVTLRGLELEAHEGIVADHPGIVPGSDGVGVSRAHVNRRSVLMDDMEMPGLHHPAMGGLTRS